MRTLTSARFSRRFRFRRIALILAAFFLSLALVNQISMLIGSCNKFPNPESHQYTENNATDYKCTARDGIILQGVSLLAKIPPEWLGAISSMFIAVFTLTLWIATDRLWRISLIHARHMERSVRVARETVNAAGISANASLRSATAAERALVFVERAWVDITVKPSGDIIIGANIITANLSRNIQNFGRSPALKTSPTQRLFPTFNAAFQAHARIAEIFRQIVLDAPIPNTIGGMLAPNQPYEETIAIEMPRPRDDDLPPDDSDGDYVGLFVLAGVSYASPASTRPQYTTGIFEIASKDGRSINFRNRGEFVLKADENTVRAMGIGRAV